MGYKNLGANYTCDSCGKVVHTINSRPEDWTVVRVETTDGISHLENLYLCDDCWPKTNPEVKRNIIRRFKDFIGVKHDPK